MTDLQNLILLRLIDFTGQAAVGDCIVDDWLVRLGAGLLKQLGTCGDEARFFNQPSGSFLKLDTVVTITMGETYQCTRPWR